MKTFFGNLAWDILEAIRVKCTHWQSWYLYKYKDTLAYPRKKYDSHTNTNTRKTSGNK